MKVVLFEGIQGTGKSTIKKWAELNCFGVDSGLSRIAASSQGEYVKLHDDAMAELFNGRLKTVLECAHSKDIYVDRFLASEYVFGTLVDRPINVPKLLRWEQQFKEICQSHGYDVYYLHINAPYSFVEKNVWAKYGPYFSELLLQNYSRALNLYRSWYFISDIQYTVYNVDPQLPMEENARNALKCLEA